VRRLLPFALAPLLALSACDWVKIERTPREFYSQRDPARMDQRDDDREIRDRVRNFAEALGNGNRGRALTALNPNEEVLVIGSDASGGVARIGVRGLAEALDSLALPTAAIARTPDLRVMVGLRETTGWFSAPIEFIRVGGPPGGPRWLRASGVFHHDRGEWRLVQIHLSPPTLPPADSAAADSSRSDSASRRR
jgi:hypothetical protein